MMDASENKLAGVFARSTITDEPDDGEILDAESQAILHELRETEDPALAAAEAEGFNKTVQSGSAMYKRFMR